MWWLREGSTTIGSFVPSKIVFRRFTFSISVEVGIAGFGRGLASMGHADT
jgi:hypothetical protein